MGGKENPRQVGESQMQRVVTIFCDASFDQRTKAAGWAVWIKCNGKAFMRARPFKKLLYSAACAEMGGIVYGLSYASHFHGKGKDMWFIVACDNMFACDVVNGVAGTGKKFRGWNSESEPRDRLFALCAELRGAGCKVEARHVKGHAGGTDKRSYINEKMDTMAKEAMRQKRKELKNAVRIQATVCATDYLGT